jgi:hypothetical protein
VRGVNSQTWPKSVGQFSMQSLITPTDSPRHRMASDVTIWFGPFELDLGTGERRRSNQRVKLNPHPVQSSDAVC